MKKKLLLLVAALMAVASVFTFQVHHAKTVGASGGWSGAACASNTFDPMACVSGAALGYPVYNWWNNGWHSGYLPALPSGLKLDPRTWANVCVTHGNGPDATFVAGILSDGNVWYTGFNGSGWGPWVNIGGVPFHPYATLTCALNPQTGTQNVIVIDNNGYSNVNYNSNEANPGSWSGWRVPF